MSTDDTKPKGMKDGGPAFPQFSSIAVEQMLSGMSLRDWFVSQSIHAAANISWEKSKAFDPHAIIKIAASIADEAIKERKDDG